MIISINNVETSVKGLFKYSAGITWDEGDLVIASNGVLYRSLSRNSGDPLSSSEFELAIEPQIAKSLSDLTEDSTKLVTGDIFLQAISNYLMGFTREGSVDVVPYNSAELDYLRRNCVRFLSNVAILRGDTIQLIPGSFEGCESTNSSRVSLLKVPTSKLPEVQLNLEYLKLLRVFHTTYEGSEVIVQEIVDLQDRAIYLRRFLNGQWTGWTPIWNETSATESARIAYEEYSSLLSKVLQRAQEMERNAGNYYSFYRAKHSKGGPCMNLEKTSVTLTPSYVVTGSIAICFLRYKLSKSSIWIAQSISIDPSEVEEDTMYSIDSTIPGFYLRLSNSSGSVNISIEVPDTMKGMGVEFTDVILSKPSNLLG